MPSGTSGAVRVSRLSGVALAAMEAHGKRDDRTSQARKVREAEPLTTTGLDLRRLLEEHTAGAMVHKSATKALHLIVQFPKDLVSGQDGEWMLEQARDFSKQVFGDRAVFADRVDRDETSLHVVDLFVAPKYEKQTKRKTTTAISTSRHLKDLARKHGKAPNLRGQGQALQQEWFEHLRGLGLEVERGAEKGQRRSDWVPPEEVAAKERSEALREAQRALQAENATLAAENALMASREEKLRVREAKVEAKAAANAEKSRKLIFSRSEIVRQGEHDVILKQERAEQNLKASQVTLGDARKKLEQAEREAMLAEHSANRVNWQARQLDELDRDNTRLKNQLEDRGQTISAQFREITELKKENTRLEKGLEHFTALFEVMYTKLKELFPKHVDSIITQVNAAWKKDPRHPDKTKSKSRGWDMDR